MPPTGSDALPWFASTTTPQAFPHTDCLLPALRLPATTVTYARWDGSPAHDTPTGWHLRHACVLPFCTFILITTQLPCLPAVSPLPTSHRGSAFTIPMISPAACYLHALCYYRTFVVLVVVILPLPTVPTRCSYGPVTLLLPATHLLSPVSGMGHCYYYYWQPGRHFMAFMHCFKHYYYWYYSVIETPIIIISLVGMGSLVHKIIIIIDNVW